MHSAFEDWTEPVRRAHMRGKKVERASRFLRTTGPGPAGIWVLFIGFQDERVIEAKESRKNRHIDWLW